MISRRGALGPGKWGERGRTEEPIEPARLQNWIATGLFSVCAVFAVLTFPESAVFGFGGGVYLAFLAPAAFAVRPHPRRQRVFDILMGAIVLQGVLLLTGLYPIAAEILTGEEATQETFRTYVPAAGIALFFGWIPSLALFRAARRGLLLLLLQVIGPLVALLFFATAFLVNATV